MIRYKVWVHVEREDEEADDYCDIDLPVSVGEFKFRKAAEALRDRLVRLGCYQAPQVQNLV